MDKENYILERLPHRQPFLWIDRVREISEDRIMAEKHISADLEVFQGHYPGHPILPGVLVCEALFQAGALLISERISKQGGETGPSAPAGVPVLTRIQGARFKRGVYPGDNLELKVTLQEKMGSAWFMKGTALVGGKTSVKVEFACTLTT